MRAAGDPLASSGVCEHGTPVEPGAASKAHRASCKAALERAASALDLRRFPSFSALPALAAAESAPPGSATEQQAHPETLPPSPPAPAAWSAYPCLLADTQSPAGSLWSLAVGSSTDRLMDVEGGGLTALGPIYLGARLAALRWRPALRGESVSDDATGAELTELLQEASGAHALSLSSDGETLFCGGADGRVRALCAASGAERRVFHYSAEAGAEEVGVYALALLPSATGAETLVAGGEGGTLRMWDSASGALGIVLEDGHAAAVTALAVTPAADADSLAVTLASGCEAGALVGWRGGATPAELADADLPAHAWRVDSAHAGGVTAIVWHSTTRTLYSAGFDGAVRATRLSDGACLGHWPRAGCVDDDGPAVPIRSLSLAAELGIGGQQALWMGTDEGTVLRLGLDGGCSECLLPEAHAGRPVTALYASPCGELLLSAGADRTARCWALAPPCRWSAASHARFPAPFRSAMAQLARGASSGHLDDTGGDGPAPQRRLSALASAFGGLDSATREGLLQKVASHLALAAYGEES